jgi:hypothetical protein
MTIRKSGPKSGDSGAATPGRIRRPPPSRTEPVRTWPGVLRQQGSWNSASPLTTSATEEPRAKRQRAADALDGVQLGYDVIERHMQRAAAVARQYRPNRRQTAPKGGPDVQNTIARVVRSVTDLVPLVGELINSASAAGFVRSLPDLAGGLDGHHSYRAFADANSRVAIALSAPQPITATLELRPRAEHRPLVTAGLFAPGAVRPTVKNIVFANAAGGRQAALRIRAPRLRAGVIYCGMLIDRQTGEALGVISLRVAT